MKKRITRNVFWLAAVFLCGCATKYPVDPPFGYFDFYYKSNINPDLLAPNAGIYNPANVRIYEWVATSRSTDPIPAISNNDNYLYKYVWDKGIHEGIYYITYNCSIYNIYQKKNQLKMTTIELGQGVTDTLTFNYKNGAYPDHVFYNGKLVWSLGDGHEITIVK